jgi:hypothetical protein
MYAPPSRRFGQRLRERETPSGTCGKQGECRIEPDLNPADADFAAFIEDRIVAPDELRAVKSIRDQLLALRGPMKPQVVGRQGRLRATRGYWRALCTAGFGGAAGPEVAVCAIWLATGGQTTALRDASSPGGE